MFYLLCGNQAREREEAMWFCMSAVPTQHGEVGQEDCEFKVTLGYTVSSVPA